MPRYDYVLVGGGLQNALIALAVRAHRPEARVALVERSPRLGGNHTWCVHARDIPQTASPWIEPLLAFRWPNYTVAFPRFERTIDEQYVGISSARLDSVVGQAFAGHSESRLLLGTEAVQVSADRVVLSNGEELTGAAVVDSRGMGGPAATCGYQKFVGLEIELGDWHGMLAPLLMDARVDQTEGYRFMYVLPLGDRSVLLEDTYFNRSPTLDRDRLRAGIRGYAEARGWTVRSVLREESGVLPMPCTGHRISVSEQGPLLGGFRGGWFHPGTGYSFPIAIRLAEAVAERSPNRAFGSRVSSLAQDVSEQARFARFLNRMLFRWYPPTARRSIFERFFRLPDETIQRFFGLRMTWADRRRLLVGRPPRGLSIRYRFGGGGR